jgi:hypothetical protein
MPRQKQTLSIEQINEILNDQASEETIFALKSFLKAELERRRYAGNTGGRPQTVENKKEANREYQRRWRSKHKGAKQ